MQEAHGRDGAGQVAAAPADIQEERCEMDGTSGLQLQYLTHCEQNSKGYFWLHS